MEFHISRAIRERLDIDDLLFSFSGNVVFSNVAASRKLAQRLNEALDSSADPKTAVNAGALFAMGLIDELNHALIARYRQDIDPLVLAEAVRWAAAQVQPQELERLLLTFTEQFPNVAIFRGTLTAQQWLDKSTDGVPNREAAFEELLMLWLANINPAFAPFKLLFDDTDLEKKTFYDSITRALPDFFATRPPVDSKIGSLLDALRAPMLASPDSLTGQLDFIREQWSKHLGEELRRVLLAIDVLREEDIAIWMRFHPPGPDHHTHGEPGRNTHGFRGDEYVGFDDEFGEYVVGSDGKRHRRYATDYQAPLNEYEAFSADQAWMPNVVLIAKSTFVWLEQLSKKYGRHIQYLNQIPDEELHILTSRGVTGLWLIGLWERSKASRTIKRLRGNADAVASAYSLQDYRIADDLGGEAAYRNLRDRAARAGLRLASDMVPNHMGIDSDWVVEHPDWFIYRNESPFPSYNFEGPDLSTDSRVEIKIEDHYYDQTDAAVVFRLRHHGDGRTRFMYHGNDGTTFAWNDTAQIDYSKADVREHVMQVILDVARRFPIIRFDAAMVLAKRHVQRLWFPLPGAGGSIPSRAENALSQEEFDALMPLEFWREVVDRVAVEVPGTLLLAEAFWLLEGYFVRTLGMHRVYNSAFMNMLRDEENAKYRSYLKKTVEFDPDILKRYVNFMSNPDERTAIDQFGSGDKYFGVCALLATLPGLPMLGHGQVEGFTERYGMDFKEARLEEYPNDHLIARHQQEIAPLLKNRALFADSVNFVMYDLWTDHGTVDENVFAYSNRYYDQRSIILYNNSYGSTRGTIHVSVAAMDKGSGELRQKSLADGLDLTHDDSTIIAYRDTVQNLEYLRWAGDLRRSGLTLDLRGYQHVVLLNWRELRASADYPWDELCNALNGGGVYSVEESLSQLRMRPLNEALRYAVSNHNLQILTEVAHSTRQPAKTAKRTAPPLDGRLEALVLNSITVHERMVQLLPPAPQKPAPAPVALPLDGVKSARPVTALDSKVPTDSQVPPAPDFKTSCSQAIASSSSLPAFYPLIADTLPRAFKRVLPSAERDEQQSTLFAPVLVWLITHSVIAQGFEPPVVDSLPLKASFAEVFSSLGIEHETAWRLGARVRLLLLYPELSAFEATTLWQDPDLRWLAGVHDSEGKTYFNKESFEELLAFFTLPALLDLAALLPIDTDAVKKVAAQVSALAARAKDAGYHLDTFLKPAPTPDPTPDPPKAPKPPAPPRKKAPALTEAVEAFEKVKAAKRK